MEPLTLSTRHREYIRDRGNRVVMPTVFTASHHEFPQSQPFTLDELSFLPSFQNGEYASFDFDSVSSISSIGHGEIQAQKEKYHTMREEILEQDPQRWAEIVSHIDVCQFRLLDRCTQCEMIQSGHSFLKMYEILKHYPQVVPVNKEIFSTLHLCEGPGDFVLAINHIVDTERPSMAVEHEQRNMGMGRQSRGLWKWKAVSYNTLNECTKQKDCVSDVLMVSRPQNWDFLADGTGNLLDQYNFKSFPSYSVDMITADGVMGSSEEENISLVWAQVLLAFSCLNSEGTLILKLTTMFHDSTVSLLYYIWRAFTNVSIVKPTASHPVSSECFVVAQGFRNIPSRIIDFLKFVFYKNDIGRMLYPAGSMQDVFLKAYSSIFQSILKRQLQFTDASLKALNGVILNIHAVHAGLEKCASLFLAKYKVPIVNSLMLKTQFGYPSPPRALTPPALSDIDAFRDLKVLRQSIITVLENYDVKQTIFSDDLSAAFIATGSTVDIVNFDEWEGLQIGYVPSVPRSSRFLGMQGITLNQLIENVHMCQNALKPDNVTNRDDFTRLRSKYRQFMRDIHGQVATGQTVGYTYPLSAVEPIDREFRPKGWPHVFAKILSPDIFQKYFLFKESAAEGDSLDVDTIVVDLTNGKLDVVKGVNPKSAFHNNTALLHYLKTIIDMLHRSMSIRMMHKQNTTVVFRLPYSFTFFYVSFIFLMSSIATRSVLMKPKSSFAFNFETLFVISLVPSPILLKQLANLKSYLEAGVIRVNEIHSRTKHKKLGPYSLVHHSIILEHSSFMKTILKYNHDLLTKLYAHMSQLPDVLHE
ncbi:hypothetical protein PCE1_000053 [Barthelona sp. PCE]